MSGKERHVRGIWQLCCTWLDFHIANYGFLYG